MTTDYNDGYPKGDPGDPDNQPQQIIYETTFAPDPADALQDPRVHTAFRFLDHAYSIRHGGNTHPRQLTQLEASVEDAALITLLEYLQPGAVPNGC